MNELRPNMYFCMKLSVRISFYRVFVQIRFRIFRDILDFKIRPFSIVFYFKFSNDEIELNHADRVQMNFISQSQFRAFQDRIWVNKW